MTLYNPTGMKKWLYYHRWLILAVLGANAFVAIDVLILGNLSMDASARVISIQDWVMKIILVGMVYWMARSAYRGIKRSIEEPTADDLDEPKHQDRLRYGQRADRWAPRIAAALIVITAGLLALGVSQEAAFTAGVFGVFIAILWIIGKPFLKVDQISDPAKRQTARAQVLWKLANQCPLWIGTVLLIDLAILSLPARFGISLPTYLGLVLFFPFVISFMLGSWMLGAGLAGQPAEAPRSQQCEESPETPPQPTRWRRSPKLISIGAVALALAFASTFLPFNAAVDRATASVSTTRGLIAFLRGNDDYDDVFDVADRIVWPELESRMPLDAKNRDRLIEEFLFRAGGEQGTFSMMTPGMGDWFKKELGHGPHAQEHLDRALEIIENTNIPKETVYHIATLFEALYATPASAFTPEQFDRLVSFTLTALESQEAHGSLVTLGGCTWITEQSKSGRLSPQQEERLHAHTDAGNTTEQ